jgi:hypothetical protein
VLAEASAQGDEVAALRRGHALHGGIPFIVYRRAPVEAGTVIYLETLALPVEFMPIPLGSPLGRCVRRAVFISQVPRSPATQALYPLALLGWQPARLLVPRKCSRRRLRPTVSRPG